MQPTFTQVPPRPQVVPAGEGLTKLHTATRLPSCAAVFEAASPPEPPPITTRSKCCGPVLAAGGASEPRLIFIETLGWAHARRTNVRSARSARIAVLALRISVVPAISLSATEKFCQQGALFGRCKSPELFRARLWFISMKS